MNRCQNSVNRLNPLETGGVSDNLKLLDARAGTVFSVNGIAVCTITALNNRVKISKLIQNLTRTLSTQ